MASANKRITMMCALMLVAVVLSGCAPATQLSAGGDALYDRIDAWVQAEMQSSHIPGLALGIVKGSEIVYLKGYGTADSSGRPVTPQTPFVLASVSKSITALAVMQLVEAGSVELDAPVTRYLPGFRTADSTASAGITVRQLLNQTSGLATGTGNLLNFNNGGKPLDDLVSKLGKAELASVPDSVFHYSNANYILLASIVEHVTGQTYDEYVHAYIFAPLGMAGSSVELTDGIAERIAAGYQPWFGFPVKMKPYSRVACLNNISTAEDMAKYLAALMNGGSYNGSTVITPGSIVEMQKPVASMKTGVSYAMGFEIDTTRPYALIKHPGDAPGFNANIAILPGEGWGIVVLQNTNWLGMEGETGRIISGIEDMLQGMEPAGQPLSPVYTRYMFNAVYAVTLFFLVRALLLLGRWRRRVGEGSRERLRRRLIPVIMINFSMPVGILLFVPKFFSANWAIGFRNAPDFCLMMVTISVLLLVIGAVKMIFIISRMAANPGLYAAANNPAAGARSGCRP